LGSIPNNGQIICLPPYTTGIFFIKRFLSEVQSHPKFSYHPFVKTAESLLLEISSKIAKNQIPSGAIHSDIFPDNVMFNGDNVVAIIDWEEASYDKLVIDVAVVILSFCFPDGKSLDRKLAKAFLESYHKERPLTQSELIFLPTFINYCALGVACWRFRQYNVLFDVESRRNIHLDMLQRIGSCDNLVEDGKLLV